MTKNLVWRLQEKPTPSDIALLVEKSIITKEEAKDVFFREDEKPKKATPSELESIKKEVELLRELVLEIGKKQPATIYPIIIREYEKTFWPSQPWTQPYITWCSSNTSNALDDGYHGITFNQI